MTEQICYSEDGETFNIDYDGMMDDVLNRCEGDIGDTVVAYQGISVPRTHEDYVCVDGLIELMREAAWDDLSDFTDGYLDEMTPELAESLKAWMLTWLNANLPQPTFHGVRDVKPINVILED